MQSRVGNADVGPVLDHIVLWEKPILSPVGCPAFTVLEYSGIFLALCGQSCDFLVLCLSQAEEAECPLGCGELLKKDLTQAENSWYLGYYGAAEVETEALNAVCDERGARSEKKVWDWSSTSSKELEIRVEQSRAQSWHLLQGQHEPNSVPLPEKSTKPVWSAMSSCCAAPWEAWQLCC